MFASSRQQQQQSAWAIAHLEAEEPEAAPYLHDWADDSTLASTPSVREGSRNATILRDDGKPSHIIISVERKISMSKRALRKLLKALRSFLKKIRNQKHSSAISNADDTAQPSLGRMGVMV